MSTVTILGRALFAPEQHPFFMDVAVASDTTALRSAWGEAPGWRDDCRAFCSYDYDAKGECLGMLVFERQYCMRALVAHECTHAAVSFVGSRVMQSAAVAAMAEDEAADYYHEALATVVEKLFESAERSLFASEARAA